MRVINKIVLEFPHKTVFIKFSFSDDIMDISVSFADTARG